jgi:hypothetical protein
MQTPAKFLTFLSKLSNVTEHKPGLCWSASCPAHPHDNKPSLSVNIGQSGNLVLSCHSAAYGCTAPAIMKAVGMTMSDLFLADKPGFERSKVAKRPLPDIVYPYHYEDGTLAYETCRYNNPKDFAQRRPNPKWRPGAGEPRYVWNLDGVRMVLYRLPYLLEGMREKPNNWVALVEGEKCSDTLETLGIMATTHALGSDHWRTEYAEPLTGRKVAIFYDCDPYYPRQRKRPGPAWAVQAARDLLAVGCQVRICKPPGCEIDTKDDVADYVLRNKHKTANEIRGELFDVISRTTDYFPGWELKTGFASLQWSHRERLKADAPEDMNEAFELVRRRLGAALDGVRLDTLPSDLANVAAWCQWLAETLNSKMSAVNIQLGETPAPVVSSTQSSEPTPEGTASEEDAAQTENAAQALCLPANTEAAQVGFDGEPEPI